MTAKRLVDALQICALRARGLGGIPVEFKGATIPAPDQRRSYS